MSNFYIPPTRYECPYGDYTWTQRAFGEIKPLCPKHSTILCEAEVIPYSASNEILKKLEKAQALLLQVWDQSRQVDWELMDEIREDLTVARFRIRQIERSLYLKNGTEDV